jgi:hypothetical protein
VKGYGFCDLLTSCEVRRPVYLFMRDAYGRDFETPADATAETHLFDCGFVDYDDLLEKEWFCDYWDPELDRCTAGHWEYKAYAHFVTTWKISLVK